METNTCRLCLIPISKEYLKNAFENNFNLFIKTYINIEIQVEDNFSNWICLQCATILNNFHSYVERVKHNNEFLINQSENRKRSEFTETKKESQETEGEQESDQNFISEVVSEDLKVEDSQKNESNDSDSDGDTEWDDQSNDSNYSDSNDDHVSKRMRNEDGHDLESQPYKETPADIRIKQLYKYDCKLCTTYKEFQTFRAFKDHHKLVHDAAAYIDCCGRRFTKSVSLNEHLDIHLNPDMLTCTVCGKKLRTKSSLSIHMDTHVPIDQRPHKCKVCNAAFMQKHSLTRHEIIHITDEEQLKFGCNKCSKRFVLEKYLKEHLKKTHLTVKKYVCDACAKSFKTKFELKQHLYMHSDEGRKQCEKCGTWFRTPRTYILHMRDKHDDSAPTSFPCSICEHVCPSRAALYSHKLVKHKPKRHKCTFCEECFSTPQMLRKHLTKHTGPGAPLQCDICSKLLLNKHSLRGHKRKVHSNPKNTLENH